MAPEIVSKVMVVEISDCWPAGEGVGTPQVSLEMHTGPAGVEDIVVGSLRGRERHGEGRCGGLGSGQQCSQSVGLSSDVRIQDSKQWVGLRARDPVGEVGSNSGIFKNARHRCHLPPAYTPFPSAIHSSKAPNTGFHHDASKVSCSSA